MEETVDSDRVIIINDGKIALEGKPEQVFCHKEEIKSMGLELPPATVLADKLIEKGVKLPQGILTEQRLKEELCKLQPKI